MLIPGLPERPMISALLLLIRLGHPAQPACACSATTRMFQQIATADKKQHLIHENTQFFGLAISPVDGRSPSYSALDCVGRRWQACRAGCRQHGAPRQPPKKKAVSASKRLDKCTGLEPIAAAAMTPRPPLPQNKRFAPCTPQALPVGNQQVRQSRVVALELECKFFDLMVCGETEHVMPLSRTPGDELEDWIRGTCPFSTPSSCCHAGHAARGDPMPFTTIRWFLFLHSLTLHHLQPSTCPKRSRFANAGPLCCAVKRR